jgi:hypothetical protein
MWKWDSEMRQLGFRRRGERFWLCERRHGLTAPDHISVFCWSERALPAGAFLVEMTEFHVTFYRGGEQLHFYYHEVLDNHWQPGGHTSRGEIQRLGLDTEELRAAADVVAEALAEALGGLLLPRRGEDG